jgi:hypothetical protein
VLDRSGLLQINGRNITVDGAEIGLRGGRISKVVPGGAGAGGTAVTQLGPITDPRAVVELSVVDKSGHPVSEEPFRVVFPDGTVRTGATDKAGRSRIPGSAEGICKVSLTRLDGSLWERKGAGRGTGAEVTRSAGRSHRVRKGECAASIAHTHGVHWRTLWDHPQNRELVQKRKNPNVLFEGDSVFLPEKERKTVQVRTGERLELEANLEPTPILFRLLGESGPRADLAYVLELDDGTRREGKTDSEGKADLSIPPHVKLATLRVETGLGPEAHLLQLGRLDPVGEICGVQQRLRGLGFACDETGETDEPTRLALAEFQRQRGIDPTGEADERTRNDLVSVYGS